MLVSSLKNIMHLSNLINYKETNKGDHILIS